MSKNKITKAQYEFALARIEELLPLVDDNTPANDKNAIELDLISNIVWEYEEEHYPIEHPTVSELIALSLEGHAMTQKELAGHIGVSPSRINDYHENTSFSIQPFESFLCSIRLFPIN